MNRRLFTGSAILAIALLNFFQFPGHTWLQSDTQVYVPILEHIWDPSVFQNDLLVQHPHVAFTLYDETAIALRRLTDLGFKEVLQGEQFIIRILGIWGVFLIVTAMGLPDLLALLVTAIFSLGATIVGPAVLVFEYEPVPRGCAVALIFLAIGLIAHQRYIAAGIASSVAFVLHAPTALPFCALFFCLALWPAKPHVRRQKLAALGIFLVAALALLIASRFQAAAGESQPFLSRLDPAQEQLQRMRASYNWISLWWRQYLGHYVLVYLAGALACRRLQKEISPSLRFFAIGLPLLGLLSVPASYLLLERMRWALIPQLQPMRTLLFVTTFAMLLGAVAACKAALRNRYLEAVLWLALAYLLPANRVIEWPAWNRLAVVIALSVLSTAAVRAASTRWAHPAIAAAIVAPFFLIPSWGRMENYPPLHTPALRQISDWSRTFTPKAAVFLFPQAGQDLEPGIFRAQALRAVYVDWKTGGQVNFFRDLGEQWWSRWQQTLASPFQPSDFARYRTLGIDYVVLSPAKPLPDATPVFRNAQYVIYKL